jgi:tRNA A-37 threonylcarbamoyl transferase component Bud32
MLTSGSLFAGYRIERVLGAGGMGTVYLARSPALPRHDAIKALSPELSRDTNFRARFLREAEVAAGLSHPNIVSIYSRGEFQGQLWIAMQYVDGSDAESALRAGTMNPARAVFIVGEVAKALDYAHYHQVVHRDVKPANFLLSHEASGPERVLLGDFGIARALDDVGLTMTGSFVGTVAYAAPEGLAGMPVDGRADTYTLGCTLFRLLTGKTPYSRSNGMAAVVTAHLHQPPPRVTDWMPNLPPRLDAVIARAMAKDPAGRFGSACELAEAATEALSDRTTVTGAWQPVTAAQVSGYQNSAAARQWWQGTGDPRTAMAPRPPAPRRRMVIGAVVGVAVVGAAAVIAGTTLTGRSSETAAAPSEPTSSAAGPAGGPVRLTALAGLLLPADDAAPLMGKQSLGSVSTFPVPLDNSAALDDKECVGIWLPGDKATYVGSGFEGTQIEVLGGELGGPQSLSPLIQGVAAFSSVDNARQFVEAQRAQWAKCGNRVLTVNNPDRPPMRLSLTTLMMMPVGVMIVIQDPDEYTDLPCERAMTVRNNVVIDVRACTLGSPSAGQQIASAIAEKVPQ